MVLLMAFSIFLSVCLDAIFHLRVDLNSNSLLSPYDKSSSIVTSLLTSTGSANPSRNKLKGESGLGMTIARDIVRSHGGDIKLSKSDLGGLQTIINLPL